MLLSLFFFFPFYWFLFTCFAFQFVGAQEIFQLIVAAFKNLSNVASRCYTKAVSVLDTFARVRLCLVMLDLECDELIIEMFQQFLKKIR